MFHRTELIGNLGADPEMKYTANGTAVTTFNVAVNERWNNANGERQERTEWYSVVAWQRLAETCAQYLAKGRQVYVAGRMQTRSWDGTDGVKHYRTELVATEVHFLGGQGEGRTYAGSDRMDTGGAGKASGGHLLDEALQAGLPVGRDGAGDIEPDDLPF